ncbi:MAG: NUDIX domain-containing protein [Ruminococcus sp.]|nr:NUDIX domain-containing protein [Ruminococcus sp.]
MSELFDLYNEKLIPLRETAERGDPIPPGKYHLVINVLSVNFEGKVLITLRSAEKPTYPNLWEVTEGAVIAGEKPAMAAIRELKEETGLRALPEALDYRGQLVFKGGTHNHIVLFYLFRADFGEEDVILQPGETAAARLVYPAEIEQMAKQGEFISFVYQRAKAFYPDIFGEAMP